MTKHLVWYQKLYSVEVDAESPQEADKIGKQLLQDGKITEAHATDMTQLDWTTPVDETPEN